MDVMTTHTKRLFVGATSAALLLSLVGGCSSSPSVEEFCTNATVLMEGEGIENADPEDLDAVTKAVDDMIAQIEDTEAPDEIADDWDYFADGMTELLEAAKKTTAAQAEDSDAAADDVTEATDEMKAAVENMSSEKMMAANDKVETYITENCEA